MSEKAVRFKSDAEQAGFAQLPNVVLFDPELKDGAKLTYAALIHFARRSDECWPSLETLGGLRGVSDRQIRTHITALKKAGLLEVKRTGLGRPNLYRLLPLASLDRKATAAPTRKPTAGEEEAVGRRTPSVSPSFGAWLEHHEAVTGHKPPKPTTQAYRALASSYDARRREGWDELDLKAATIGAHADEFRRTHNYDVAESVLRPTKITKLVNAGQRELERQGNGDAPAARLPTGAETRAAVERAREMEKRRA